MNDPPLALFVKTGMLGREHREMEGFNQAVNQNIGRQLSKKVDLAFESFNNFLEGLFEPFDVGIEDRTAKSIQGLRRCYKREVLKTKATPVPLPP